MSKKITHIGFYLLLILVFAQCSGANFGGGDQDRASPSAQILSDDDNSPAPQPQPSLNGELVVYQSSLINGGLSFDKVNVELTIAESESPILLFIHLQQASVIHLKGDVEAVQAIFLTANTNGYNLPTSEVRRSDNSLFPITNIATGYFPNYQAGSGLTETIGANAVALWQQGVILSDFAKAMGPRKCYDLVFDTDFATNPSFNVSWNAGQTCIY